MPKNKVSDPITDQEMAFARLILSGTMTDRRAAEAVGLNPDTAAYTKSKPHVRAYMLEQRAAVQQQLVEQEAEGLRRQSLSREQVLARLWEIANMSPEMTRNSISGQVKALSMIVAIQGLIPDRHAGSAEKNPPPPPVKPHIYTSAWLRKQQGETQEEDGLGASKAESASASTESAPPDPVESFAMTNSETPSAPDAAFAPDIRVPFSIHKNPFSHRR